MACDQTSSPRVFLPVFLLGGIFTLFLAMQTAYLVSDHESLQKTHDQQDKPLAQIDKVRTQLNVLASGTLELAKKGDKNAQEIVAELKKAGIDITDKPQAPAAPPAP